MNPNRFAPILAALFLLFVASSCRSTSFDDSSPEEIARRERLIYLSSKAAAAILVEKDVAKPADLVKAADIVEAAALLDLPAALKAAGYVEAQWELFALLVQDQLEPYRLKPFVGQFVSAAARGVREGATGIPEAEKTELRELEAEPAKPISDGRQIPADEERTLRRADIAAAGEDRASLAGPVARLVELVRSKPVFDAA
jgi:hypothetical protein